MKDFLMFRRMLSPFVIMVLSWLGALAAVATGIYDLIAGITAPGIVMLLLGPIMIRFVAEFIILFFRINETLTDISNQQKLDQK
jgi:hypothetical protein